MTKENLTIQIVVHEQRRRVESAQREIAHVIHLAKGLQHDLARYTSGPVGVISSDTRSLAQAVTQLTTAVGGLAALAPVAPRD